eukprot:CAMPEP_0115848208 /NCGR_PEP_ID=MMETSP0287-20121206/10797_1 /TAXON_ID=412157 /ORGANISM="Chrysochromulina rotalis, Strain UIO044" /LENGTH=54 /DNA_ID=CAMNT_0003302101 /DNA_START=278 /DNA_END=442 /DNA_ORIENTATION=+
MVMLRCRELKGPRCCGCIQLVHCAGLFHGPACHEFAVCATRAGERGNVLPVARA